MYRHEISEVHLHFDRVERGLNQITAMVAFNIIVNVACIAVLAWTMLHRP